MQLIQLLDRLRCLPRLDILEEKRFSKPFSDLPDLKSSVADIENAMIGIEIDKNAHAARRMSRKRN